MPQQSHDAKATFRQMGVEEGIDGRETVFQLVGYRNGPEFAGLAETVELGIGPVAGQKVGELFLGRGVHVAIAMTLVDVVRVERIELTGKPGRLTVDDQVIIDLANPTMAAFGLKIRYPHPSRNAGTALIAMGTVQVIPACEVGSLTSS